MILDSGTTAIGGCCNTGIEQNMFISNAAGFPTAGLKTLVLLYFAVLVADIEQKRSSCEHTRSVALPRYNYQRDYRHRIRTVRANYWILNHVDGWCHQ